MDISLKKCFVVCPIGSAGSQIRRQSDCLYEYIIKPSLEDFGYSDPIRVDKSDKPAHITTEIIQNLISSDLVIADLSTLNPNVFYELGIRHAYNKPCILVSDWIDSPPFDVAGINTIKYVHDDPTSHLEVIGRIREQLTEIEQEKQVSNPVSVAIGFQKLEASGDDFSQLFVQMSEQIKTLSSKIDASNSVEERPRQTKIVDHKLSIGDYIFHAKFGDGVVVAVDGDKISIEFERYPGVRTIVSKFLKKK